MGFIYALVDPNTNKVRYVGKTVQKTEKRFKQHLQLARNNSRWPVCRWIKKLAEAYAEATKKFWRGTNE